MSASVDCENGLTDKLVIDIVVSMSGLGIRVAAERFFDTMCWR
jgi:hypothetical protein